MASHPFDAVTGRSPAIQQVIDLAKKVAPTDTTVLLNGGTSTGKVVFANAIHAAGTRNGKPFLAVNCSTLSRELLDSELFGHVAGAFTGAVKARKHLSKRRRAERFSSMRSVNSRRNCKPNCCACWRPATTSALVTPSRRRPMYAWSPTHIEIC